MLDLEPRVSKMEVRASHWAHCSAEAWEVLLEKAMRQCLQEGMLG
jgi:hypothetical protein